MSANLSFTTGSSHGDMRSLLCQQPKQLEIRQFLEANNYHLMESFASMLQQHDGPVIAVNLNMKIIYMNSCARDSFLADRIAGANLPLETLIRLDDDEDKEAESQWEELFRRGLLVGVNFDRRIHLNHRLSVRAAVTGAPLFDRVGDLVGTVILFKLKPQTQACAWQPQPELKAVA